MHDGSSERPSPGNSVAPNQTGNFSENSASSTGMHLGSTPVHLERGIDVVAPQPHHPLVTNHRDRLSNALRQQMRALGERRDSLENNVASPRSKSEEAERAKAAVLANLSHEFRTPLNAIIGFSELLLSEPVGQMNEDRQRDYIADIHRSGVDLLKMIDGLLNRAERSDAAAPPVTANADHRDVFSDVCGALEPTAQPQPSGLPETGRK